MADPDPAPLMTSESPIEDRWVFQRRSDTRSLAMLAIGGALVLLAGAAVGFFVAMFGSVGQLQLHLMTTLPVLLGLGALFSGFSMLRAPDRVELSPQGLAVASGNTRTLHEWGEMGWATISAAAMGHKRQLVVYNQSGKAILKLTDAFDGFDALANAVKQRVSATAGETANRLRLAKARRTAWFLLLFTVLMGAGSAFMAYDTAQTQRAARLLEEEAVAGEGRILRRFIAPNGVTRRVEYEVTGDDRKVGKRNVEVEAAYWEALEGADEVPVLYVPQEPAISRLAFGEVEEQTLTATPVVGYLMSVAAGVIALLMAAGALLAFKGWDLDLDSQTGRFSIKRYGEGR